MRSENKGKFRLLIEFFQRNVPRHRLIIPTCRPVQLSEIWISTASFHHLTKRNIGPEKFTTTVQLTSTFNMVTRTTLWEECFFKRVSNPTLHHKQINPRFQFVAISFNIFLMRAFEVVPEFTRA